MLAKYESSDELRREIISLENIHSHYNYDAKYNSTTISTRELIEQTNAKNAMLELIIGKRAQLLCINHDDSPQMIVDDWNFYFVFLERLVLLRELNEWLGLHGKK